MNKIEYLASLRSSLLKIVTGVEDAKQNWGWDNTTPNSNIRRNLISTRDTHIALAQNIGINFVRIHTPCGDENHPIKNGYGGIPEASWNKSLEYKDGKYHWGNAFSQGNELNICPCGKFKKPVNHHVLNLFVYENAYNKDFCETFDGVFSYLTSAIDASEDKKPRSKIRENLLRAVLDINDLILPEPMENYINYARQR